MKDVPDRDLRAYEVLKSVTVVIRAMGIILQRGMPETNRRIAHADASQELLELVVVMNQLKDHLGDDDA